MPDTGDFWTFQVPNLIMAALMYTLLGRFLLSLFIPETSDKVLMVVFRQITQPVVAPVRFLTPRAVPERVILLFAFVWLLAVRIALFIGLRMYGIAPPLGS